VLSWLAIVREPVMLEDCSHAGVSACARPGVGSVDGLRRRSLIERGQRAAASPCKSVVLEYVTQAGHPACEEIGQGRLLGSVAWALSAGQGLCAPDAGAAAVGSALLARLYQGRASGGQLAALLDGLRERAEEAQGYGPATWWRCCGCCAGICVVWNLSQLSAARRVSARAELQDATLAGALIVRASLPRPSMLSGRSAISRSGQYWAAGSKRGGSAGVV